MNSPSRPRPSFLEGVGVAILFSLVGAVFALFLASFFSGGLVLRWLVAALGLVYVIYLLARSRERTGRVTVITAWFTGAVALWLLHPEPPLYVAVHLVMVWLVRCLYFYSSVLSALADLGLTGVSFAVAVWAGMQTHSLLASIWCFFLVQALFATIPANWRKAHAGDVTTRPEQQRFDRAHHAATSAVSKLST